MINKQGFIAQRILPIFLVLLLLSPVWVTLAHEVSEHEHPVCEDISTHFHAQPVDCDLCDFTQVSFDLIENHVVAPTVKVDRQKQIFDYTQTNVPASFELKKGRAPPTV